MISLREINAPVVVGQQRRQWRRPDQLAPDGRQRRRGVEDRAEEDIGAAAPGADRLRNRVNDPVVLRRREIDLGRDLHI